MRLRLLRVVWLVAGLAAWLALVAPASAHKSSDAYLTFQVSGEVIEERLDIALRDVDRDLGLDADDDGALNWGEVRRRWPDIVRLADGGVKVTADGQPCHQAAAAPAQLDEHSDGRYAVLRRTLRCAQPVQALEVDYTLFAGSDATHRGIARLAGPTGADRTAVLVPRAGVQRFAMQAEGRAPTRSFLGFVAEGMHHIAAGADHILFLVTLLMVAVWRREGAGWTPRASAASAWRETLRLVTAFTVAHSVTLGLAATGVLAPPSRWVESIIAASVLVAAIDNVRPFIQAPRWVMVALFGLAHGFGFAGPLQALGLQQGALALPLLGFNLGVELGQLAVVGLLLPVACAWRHAPAYRLGVVRGGSVAIAGVAAVWMVERGFDLSLWP